MVMLRSVPPVRRAGEAPGDAAASAASPAPPSATVHGLVDNATSERIYGWVWDTANPGYRLKVELRLANETVATTIADRARPDLAGNGVGDGNHAFEFPLSERWFERRAELTVVAIDAGGKEHPISVRLSRPDDSKVMAQLQRAMERLRGEQQRLRAEFARLQERAAQLPEPAAIDEIARTGHEIQQRLDALELWVSRLDDRLGEAAAPRNAKAGGRLDPWQAALLAVLASMASAIMALAAAHFLA